MGARESTLAGAVAVGTNSRARAQGGRSYEYGSISVLMTEEASRSWAPIFNLESPWHLFPTSAYNRKK